MASARQQHQRQSYLEDDSATDSDDLLEVPEQQQQQPLVDGPPPGHLHTLWYSREEWGHLWVLEKICGWKTRPLVRLVHPTTHEPYELTPEQAIAYQQTFPSTTDQVSRLMPTQCPIVLQLAARVEAHKAQTEGRDPLFVYQASPTEKEEVVLVKFRGRSYRHVAWERPADTQRYDPNNVVKNKIRKWYQQQELQYGPDWKQVLLEDQRRPLHPDEEVVDEYFSSQNLEVERILACDETEMNAQVLNQQRKKNEAQEDEATKPNLLEAAVQATLNPVPWDPEGNVRYVVKWKGLPFAEMTWEYWRDIVDAVDEAEDYWRRQQVPPNVTVPPHPHVRDFRKMQESPVYGISKYATGVDEDVAGFRLRSYQLEGVNWLLFNWWNRRSCILADEMGLGKTIQSAAFLQQLQSTPATRVRGPFLIVAPLSLVTQWQSELKSWAPDLNVVLYHGSADAREFLVQHEFYFSEPFVSKQDAARLRKQHVTKFHVLITTYEVVLKDVAVLNKIRWRTLIVDEAHRLKNSKSRLFDDLANVPRDFCILLTGTPIANATEELWALLHFANPASFDNKDQFLEKFGEMTDAQQVNELHSLLKPYLLRRVKEDVEKSLPPKEETILEVSLTPIQKTFYKAIYERNTSFLFKGAKASNAPSLMNVMMELRKCCNHPYLVKGAEERILAEAAAKAKPPTANGEDAAAVAPVEVDHNQLFAEQLIKSSGKMVLMEKLLQKLFDGGHKVLIFSQMVRVLDLLEEMLRIKKYRYERLDGTTSSSSRLHAVDRFNRKSCQRFVMLLSTRAGGLGLNLTSADVVIIFDSDWNPQNDLQAMARAHRIGQTRAVRVYRLLTAKTYEMHMFHSASLKLGLERAVLSQNREQSEESDDGTGKKKSSDREAQAKEIDELLKKGAYDVFRDEDDTEAEKFMETDIDQLLEKSSKKVTYGASATTSIGSGLGSFSKASFVADTGDGEKDVDLDDPDFWEKAVGLEVPNETPEEVAAMIDDGVKRSRKQVQVFDPYADQALTEQRRMEKIALEKMLEKEEKERAKQEKLKKKKEAKEKKKLQKEEQKAAAAAAAASTKSEKSKSDGPSDKGEKKRPSVEPSKPKKTKKNDRLRLIRRNHNADPPLERLKQAWEIPQRNRAVAAIIRFGFGRFCKVRAESNLSSLPLQDLEFFCRSYLFQIALQVAVVLVQQGADGSSFANVRSMFQEWLGGNCSKELDWICDSIRSAMQYYEEVKSGRRVLRMPIILADPDYMDELRGGAGFRALRRVGVLRRINNVFDHCLDSILDSLGHQELGKRGCSIAELGAMDADLKSRHVSSEELSLVVGSLLPKLSLRAPAEWWNRECDIALVIGTFAHGLGNYEAMINDSDLPFIVKVKKAAEEDFFCRTASKCFRRASAAARKTFDDALEAARIKAELEVQAAVAAAAKAAAKREEDAAVLRKGGADAEAVMNEMPDTQVEKAFEFDGTDSHFVTLPRMIQDIHNEMERISAGSLSKEASQEMDGNDEQAEVLEEEDDGATTGRGRIPIHPLPMPDARVLDHRLLQILKTIEERLGQGSDMETDESNPDMWKKTDDVLTNILSRRQALVKFVGSSLDAQIDEFSGIGIGGNQCGAQHRSLNDGSDYGYGSASHQLANVAYGTDSPRYLRALGIPMNLTRYAVSALVYADASYVNKLLDAEYLRFYGEDELSDAEHNGVPLSARSNSGTDPPGEPEKPVKSEDETTAAEKGDAEKLDAEPTTNGSEKPASPSPTKKVAPKVNPIDPVTRIPSDFRENAQLRASVCLAAVLYGFPASNDGSVHESMYVYLEKEGIAIPRANGLFSRSMFRDAVSSLAPDVAVPDAESLSLYVETVLLPHCLRLCVYGNGPTNRSARGSQGEYECAYGVSVHPEPGKDHPSPLPDPCLSLQDHSLEAVGQANALLRRVRLLRSLQYACQHGKLPDASLASPSRPLPLWWKSCHDVALLVDAATFGLFAVIPRRAEHPAFGATPVAQHFRATLLQSPKLQQFLDTKAEAWIEQQAEAFPTLNQLERRLGAMGWQATAGLATDQRYDNLPMFDHGGWPRS